MAAIVVTDKLDWKLSGFDLVSEIDSLTKGTHGDARIVHSGFMVPGRGLHSSTFQLNLSRS
jgi:SCY1-like protein 1